MPVVSICMPVHFQSPDASIEVDLEETLWRRPPCLEIPIRADQIAHMAQIKIWTTSVLLFNTVPVNHSIYSDCKMFWGHANSNSAHVSLLTAQSRKRWSLFSWPCMHLWQMSLLVTRFVFKFARVGR
ncbi:uncharacterized protein [Gossypium hirsutum]|uniref:Uncharacterized protein n=1 Tax=Gossypium hirsutum TaxID=3635 RepID=A0A1U8KHF3_GOSHI|nr:uncharacterized protein LOC107917008 [Gossypium hirsutum]